MPKCCMANLCDTKGPILICYIIFGIKRNRYTSALEGLFKYAQDVFHTDIRPMVEDVFLDGSGGGENAIAKALPRSIVHRDLQHIKRNILGWKSKAKSYCWIQFSADAVEVTAKMWRYMDFRNTWKQILSILEDNTLANEGGLAKYLRTEILQEGVDGEFHCRWASGLWSAPVGYRTYCSNNIERSWRTTKGLLPVNYQAQDASELIERMGDILANMVEHCDYEDLSLRGFAPLPVYLKSKNPERGERQEDGNQKPRLTVAVIRSRVEKTSASQTYLMEEVDFDVQVNGVMHRCKKLYVLPKWQLRFATEKISEMETMLRLVLASDDETWQYILSPYDFDDHRRVTERFTVVLVLEDGTVLDTHSHFMAETQTEHHHFVRGVEGEKELPLKKGPNKAKHARGRRKDKRPEHMKEVLARAKETASTPVLALEARANTRPETHTMPLSIKQQPTSLALVPVDGRCKARVWGSGKFPQCSAKAKKGEEFCGRHNNIDKRKHGCIDDEAPEDKQGISSRRKKEGAPVGQRDHAGGFASGSSVPPSGRSALHTSAPLSEASTRSRWLQPQSVAGRNREDSLLKRAGRFEAGAVELQKSPKLGLSTSTMVLRGWRRVDKDQLRDAKLKEAVQAFLHNIITYEADMEKAKKASLESDASAVRKRRESRALVSKRLRVLGLQRQETPEDGNCQFIAVCRMMGFPDDAHMELREEVVRFLKKHAHDFVEFQTDGWARYFSVCNRSTRVSV